MEEANAKSEAEANNVELVEELGRYKEAYQELEQACTCQKWKNRKRIFNQNENITSEEKLKNLGNGSVGIVTISEFGPHSLNKLGWIGCAI